MMRLLTYLLLAMLPISALAQPHEIRGTDILTPLGLPNETTITPWLGMTRAPDKNVFLGGTSADFCTEAADATLLAPVLAMGNIGLYQHANGIAPCTPAQKLAIWSLWSQTGAGTQGGGQSVGEIGGFNPIDPGYIAHFGAAYPVEANVNIITGDGDGSGSYTAAAGDARPGTVYTGYYTAGDLATIEAADAPAVAAGAKNLAIFMSPNGGGEDLDDPFATAPFWANARAAALYSGGIALDVPPTYAFLRPPNYLAMIEQIVQWAEANGLRASLTVSPYAAVVDAAGHTAGLGYDPTFFENTQLLESDLASANALPTQWVVESYDGGAPYTANGLKSSVGAPGGVMPAKESLTNVALFLARTTVTAATGTTRPGAPGAMADKGLMAPPAPVPMIAASLSNARIGPLRLADIVGWGGMALQDPSGVNITGGQINGVSFVNTVNFQASGAVNLSGSLFAVPNLPLIYNPNIPGATWLDGNRLSMGPDGGTPTAFTHTVNLQADGGSLFGNAAAFAVGSSTSVPPTCQAGLPHGQYCQGGSGGVPVLRMP